MNNKPNGYLLTELLLLCGCLGLLFTALAWCNAPLTRQYYKEQLRLAAYTMAADIRNMQQQTMFQAQNNMYTLRLSSSNKYGYILYRNNKVDRRVQFTDVTLEGDSQMKVLSYSENGNPTASGSYRLRHSQLTDRSYLLTVQPVTGRVTIYEK